jgi:molecular chaperone DnaJ
VFRGGDLSYAMESRWKKLQPARRRKSAFPQTTAASAKAMVPSLAPRWPPARPATATVWQDAPGLFSGATCPAVQGHRQTGFLTPVWHATVCATKTNKTLEVSIPVALMTACVSSLHRQRNQPGTNGGPPGDLYIEIRVKARSSSGDGGSALLSPSVSPTAALAVKSKCPRWQVGQGRHPGRHAAGRSSGCAARHRQARSSYPGDLYCHITVGTPVKLTLSTSASCSIPDESLKKARCKHSPERRQLDRTRRTSA